MANRISSLKGGANVEETRVGERQGCERGQIGDLVQAGHHGGNLEVTGAVQNQDNEVLEGRSDQGGGCMEEQVNNGKPKATGLEDIRAKTLTQVAEVDSDIKNNLHIPQTSVEEHFPHLAPRKDGGLYIICVQPATPS